MNFFRSTRLKFFLFFLLVSCALYSSFFAGKILADTAAIPKPQVPCSDQSDGIRDPEFHSLRPDQASPCKDPASTASMCSNHIRVKIDTVSCQHPPTAVEDINPTCDYQDGPQHKHVVIDLSGVKLPILGNTQDVANSQTGTDGLDDAQKMNEYASWYLAGADQKAEYGADATDKTINFSGPAKNLLPLAEQQLFRFETLHDAGTKQDFTETDDTGTQTTSTITTTHNQIVVCTAKNFFGINNPWIGVEVPIPCYDGNGNKANGKVYRLVDWWNGKFTGLIESYKVIPGWDGSTAWHYTTPPFPWQFEKEIYYTKAYNEWRGQECTILFGRLVCIDLAIPGAIDVHSNMWANLYQYIPLSDTVDEKGKEFYDNVHTSAPKVTFTDNAKANYYVINKVPRLFFAHTKEVSDATINLNKTFVPLKGVDTKSIPDNTEDNTTTCQLLKTRINAGDDLTFTNTSDKHTVDFDVYYEPKTIDCNTNTVDPCKNDTTGLCVLPIYYTYNCKSDVYAEVQLTTIAPYLDRIWQDTTAGSGSTFRKIFPKVEPGAPVNCVADIPGISNANYVLNTTQSSDTVSDLNVTNPPTSTANSPAIYFPHLGSVYEYFLHGIQTALRPKGYGDPIVNGTTCATTTTTTTTCPTVADSAVPSKYLGSFKSNFIDLANKWSAKCPGATNNMADKCYNYVASEAQKAGVNPAFALTIWLNESGASNYCEGGSSTQDMGINISSLYQNLVGQLPIFLNMAKEKLCSGVSGFPETMAGWLSRFQSSAGACNPSDSVALQYYYDVMNNTWTWVSGCPRGGKFGIQWPTDMSCP